MKRLAAEEPVRAVLARASDADTTDDTDPETAADAGGDAGTVRALVAWLADAGVGLDDVARVELLTACEELKGAAAAAQARVSVAFAASQVAAQAAAGVPASRRGRGVAHQVALARRESPARGSRHLGLAQALVRELPHTLDALTTGIITEWAATLVARATACLDPATRRDVDAQLVGYLGKLGDGALGRKAQALTYAADPVAYLGRGSKATKDRRAWIRPAPDTMSILSFLLPAVDGVACWAALDAAAKTARATGDDRSLDQLRADTAVARLTGRDPVTNPWPVQINLIMTDAALFAGEHDAAHLAGYGPIPASDARQIAATGTTRPRPPDAPETPNAAVEAPGAPKAPGAPEDWINPAPTAVDLDYLAGTTDMTDLTDVEDLDGGLHDTENPGDPDDVGDPGDGGDLGDGGLADTASAAGAGGAFSSAAACAGSSGSADVFGLGRASDTALSAAPAGRTDPAAGTADPAIVAEVTAWVRRLFTDEHGTIIDADPRPRDFTDQVRRIVTARDQVCRTPWCDAPVREIDHIVARALGGPSVLGNAEGLCQACNLAKSMPGWKARTLRQPGRPTLVVLTTPTGHEYAHAAPRAPGPEPPGPAHPSQHRRQQGADPP